MNEQDKLYDAKVRWEETRVKQLSYVSYLILTLSVAALGFALSFWHLNDSDPFEFTSSSYSSFSFLTYCLSLFLFVYSIWLGIRCAINRLRDFRETAQREKLKYEGGHQCEVNELQDLTDRLGAKTWRMLRRQIRCFSGGVLFFVVVIGLQFLLPLFIELEIMTKISNFISTILTP